MAVPRRFAAIFALMLASGVNAQVPLAPGKDNYAFPAGGNPGSTVTVTLGGTDWTPDTTFHVHDPRVKLTVTSRPGPVLMPEPPHWFGIHSFANDPRLPREVSAKFEIPADYPPGLVHWSVANANGAGPGGVFVVGAGPEVTEDETRREAQTLPALPITVNGRLRHIEEVDRYKFQAKTSGLVTCELLARHLGSDFHAMIEVRDDTGKVVADVADTEGRDPAFTFAVEKDRTYTVSLRDVDFRGYRNFTYRLKLTPGPRVVAALPMTGQRGETRKVEFVGYGIATGQAKLETVIKDVTFPREAKLESFPYTLETPFGKSQPVVFQLRDEPTATEGKLTLPGSRTRRFASRGQRETTVFSGKKGESWEFAVRANRIGSPLELSLSVLGPDGKPLPAKDDATGKVDQKLLFTLPADGDYQLVVQDQSGREPTFDSIYVLTANRPQPHYVLHAAGVTNVPVGGKAALALTVIREGGFKEPISLAVAGLPEGVTVPKDLLIPANVDAFSIPLECAKTAPAQLGKVTITGTAKLGAVTLQQPVLGEFKIDVTGRKTEADREPFLFLATTLKVPFKVKAAEADGGRRIPRGSTHLAPILIERTDGFTGEILLDMAAAQQRHRQGIRGPALPVAPGVKAIDYPVFLPEWLETTRTSRIGLIAMAQVPDAKGTPRWVLSAMEGQITMSIEGALMKIHQDAGEPTIALGENREIPLRIVRTPAFTDAVQVELIVPEALRDVLSAKTIQVPADRATALITISTKAAKPVTGTWTLTLRATGKFRSHPVVSEASLEVELSAPGMK